MKTAEKLKVIHALKERIEKAGINKVAEAYGTKTPTIYYLLDETRANKVSIFSLARLADAVKKVEEEIAEQAKKLLETINQ